MGETQTVGLTKQQRELLLDGLQYVRSSVQLEISDPQPSFVENRQRRLQEIDTLVEHLQGSRPAETTADV